MPPPISSRSVPDIISDLLTQFATLMQTESRLARAEMSEKVTQAGLGLTFIVSGAVLLIPALVVLLEAAVAALEDAGVASPISALIVGGIVLVIGLMLLLVGVSRLKAKNLMLQKTLQQLQEDASVAKRQVRPDHDYQRAA